MDGYRLVVKTHPGGFADPTPDNYHHKHSLPDEKPGWGEVYPLTADMVDVLVSEEKKYIKALLRAAAAAELVVGGGEEAEGEGEEGEEEGEEGEEGEGPATGMFE